MTLDIQVAGLQLRYGAVTALDDLSFTLPGGRIYGLLGRRLGVAFGVAWFYGSLHH